MQFDYLYQQLAHGAVMIQSLVTGVTIGQARDKPSADSWSVLEVIGHLVDEERWDFRQHLAKILNQPYQPHQQLDPTASITTLPYNERDLAKTLDDFMQERHHSLVWLNGLPAPDWDASVMVSFGPTEEQLRFSAGDMLASWVAHDNLHMRQLVELRRMHLLRLAEPYQVEYAGRW